MRSLAANGFRGVLFFGWLTAWTQGATGNADMVEDALRARQLQGDRDDGEGLDEGLLLKADNGISKLDSAHQRKSGYSSLDTISQRKGPKSCCGRCNVLFAERICKLDPETPQDNVCFCNKDAAEKIKQEEIKEIKKEEKALEQQAEIQQAVQNQENKISEQKQEAKVEQAIEQAMEQQAAAAQLAEATPGEPRRLADTVTARHLFAALVGLFAGSWFTFVVLSRRRGTFDAGKRETLIDGS